MSGRLTGAGSVGKAARVLANPLPGVREVIGDEMASIDAAWRMLAKREILKTRLMDLSPSAFVELDRLDAEATLRMAIWVPLAATIVAFATAGTQWWLAGLVVPLLVVLQWISRRRRANSKLAVMATARGELLDLIR